MSHVVVTVCVTSNLKYREYAVLYLHMNGWKSDPDNLWTTEPDNWGWHNHEFTVCIQVIFYAGEIEGNINTT